MRRLLILGVFATGCIELSEECGPSQGCPADRQCVEGVCAPRMAADVGLFADGGPVDGAGRLDQGPAPDATPRDRGPADLGPLADGFVLDATTTDAASADAGVPDVAVIDAAIDAAPRCEPAEEPDLPDRQGLDTDCDGVDGHADHALFVSPAGSDADGDGSRARPFQTIRRAARVEAPERTAIYLDVGQYREPDTLELGARSLHGGYQWDREAGWTRALGDGGSVIEVAAPFGLRIQAPPVPIVVDRVALSSGPGHVGGGSLIEMTSVAVIVALADQPVTLRDVQLRAGVGADGLPGGNSPDGMTPGRSGQDGSDGGLGGGRVPGQPNACLVQGGSGGGLVQAGQPGVCAEQRCEPAAGGTQLDVAGRDGAPGAHSSEGAPASTPAAAPGSGPGSPPRAPRRRRGDRAAGAAAAAPARPPASAAAAARAAAAAPRRRRPRRRGLRRAPARRRPGPPGGRCAHRDVRRRGRGRQRASWAGAPGGEGGDGEPLAGSSGGRGRGGCGGHGGPGAGGPSAAIFEVTPNNSALELANPEALRLLPGAGGPPGRFTANPACPDPLLRARTGVRGNHVCCARGDQGGDCVSLAPCGL
ncbi:MAG: hypothetical protein H6706_29025 [Myxococcales bacterium]|nr:hypothetical protein [Myxococcales bacterium]